MRHSVLITGALAACAAVVASGWSLAASGDDWKVAGPFGGTATTVAVDPQNTNVVLAGAMNSLLYQSSDAGATWALLDFPKHNLGEVTSILVDPANSSHYIAGALDAWGGGLYESVDAGKTWTPNADFKNVGVRALAAAPSAPSEFVAGTLKGVELSLDSGKTWKRISDPNNFEMQGITAIAIDPKDSNIIYAGTPHLPWRTSDAGKTWESIHSGMIDDSDVFSIYVDPKSPATVFASACSGIYQSASRGDGWHKLAGIPNTSRRTHVIREDPERDGTLFAGTTMGLFRSANAGLNWKVLTPTQVNAMAFDPAHPNAIYLAMDSEGVGKSLDGGDTIKLADEGFVDRQISSITRSGARLIAIETQEGASTGVFSSPDAGATWTHVAESRSLMGVHLHSIAGTTGDGKTLLAATPRQLYKTIDGGAVWRPITFHLATTQAIAPPPRSAVRRGSTKRAVPTPPRTRTVIHNIEPGEINGLSTVRISGKQAIAAATGSGLYFTQDFGERWTRADMGNASAVIALYGSPSGEGRIIAKAVDALYSSSDAEHWERLDFPLPMSDVNNVAISDDTAAPLLIATRVGLYSWIDGAKWATNSAGLQAATVSGVTYQGTGRTAYLAQYGELYKSNDGGANWAPLPTRLRSLPIRQLWAPDPQSTRLYAITSGLGILFRD